MRPEIYLSSRSVPPGERGNVVTVGNFDGVHRGHAALVERLVTMARAHGLPALVYTFEPSPAAVLDPRGPPPRICSLADRVALLGRLGVDRVVVEHFSRAFAYHSASWFVERVLGECLGARGVVVGHDLRFGRGAKGDWRTVRQGLPGVEPVRVEAVEAEGDAISSTRIRGALRRGRVDVAERLLGRPYRIRGVVVPGDARGRELGFPTANVVPAIPIVLRRGVFAVRARVEGGAWRDGVASYGWNPTFDVEELRFEVHLFDGGAPIPAGALYGLETEVQVLGWIRAERRFPDAAALTRAIERDRDRARGILEHRGR